MGSVLGILILLNCSPKAGKKSENLEEGWTFNLPTLVRKARKNSEQVNPTTLYLLVQSCSETALHVAAQYAKKTNPKIKTTMSI